MSIMSLLSIEKTSKECFVLVGGVNCFGVIVPSSSDYFKRMKRLVAFRNNIVNMRCDVESFSE